MWRRKVLWSEGLFLRPQHFQQQERHLEHLIERRARAIAPFGWGFETLELDEGAAAMGTLALQRASGLLPDGTPFDCPQNDASPVPLAIAAELKESLIYLGAVTERQGVPNAALGDETGGAAAVGGLRFAAEVAEVVDSNQGFQEPAPMQIAGLQLRLLTAAELTGAYSAVPIARIIERRADGQLVFDRQFAAPSLAVDRSGLLRGYLGELRGLLKQRVDALATRLAHPGRGGVAEIADFLMLQTVNRHGALFEHLGTVPGLHPERLYAQCVELAGDLAAFGPDRRLVRPFPAYDHDDPGASFRPVIDQLRLSLSMVLEQSAIPIELLDSKYGVRRAMIADKSLLASASFVLAVNAQMASEIVRQRFPNQLKVGPIEKIRDLVNLQLPGIGLRALPVAPRQIPYHAGFNYFELDKRHELWPLLETSGALAMHVSGEFPGLELEFWAIRT